MSTEMTSAVMTMPGSSRRNDLCCLRARRVRTGVRARGGGRRSRRRGRRAAAARRFGGRTGRVPRPSSVVIASVLPSPRPASCRASRAYGHVGQTRRRRFSGQTTTSTRPDHLVHGTVPPPGSPRWARESSESARWSPITHSRPGRHLDVEAQLGGVVAGEEVRLLVAAAVPLTVIRPRSSQQTTWSPGSPITRLT